MKSAILAFTIGLFAVACRMTPSDAQVVVIVIQKDLTSNDGGSTQGLIQVPPADLTTLEDTNANILPIKPVEAVFIDAEEDGDKYPPPPTQFGGLPHYPMYPGFPTGLMQRPEPPQFHQNFGAMPFYGRPNQQGPPPSSYSFQRPVMPNFHFQNGPQFPQSTN